MKTKIESLKDRLICNAKSILDLESSLAGEYETKEDREEDDVVLEVLQGNERRWTKALKVERKKRVTITKDLDVVEKKSITLHYIQSPPIALLRFYTSLLPI